MKRKLTLTITKTRREVAISGMVLRTDCPICQEEVETLSPVEAAESMNVGERVLAAMIASGQVHVVKTLSGGLRICKESLLFEEHLELRPRRTPFLK